ncbi:MAG: hypothetical protein L0177_06980, partial [Chloroflexi bacterium]|nr:hypothetical protein [Chloroflexota bacterium]
MTLILSHCRRCGGQVVGNYDDPRCVQCSAPAIPPAPDLSPEEGNPRATVHRLRWTVRLARMRRGRYSVPVGVEEVTIEYYLYQYHRDQPP